MSDEDDTVPHWTGVVECKQQDPDMLQVELYVRNVEETAKLFTSVFDLTIIENRAGWKHLRHRANYDIMLFTPEANDDGESHWDLPEEGTGGAGVEIVICATQIETKLLAVRALGYKCSDLRYPPWGSIEFLFRLHEGYLLRVKQPAPK